MWKNNSYFKNDKFVGQVWPRKHKVWKWGYTGGFVETNKKDAMKQIKRMAK